VSFWIHATPNARTIGVGGLHGDALRVRVRSAPVGGAANAECVELLAEALAIPEATIALSAGAKGRRKRVSIDGDSTRLAAELLLLASGARLG